MSLTEATKVGASSSAWSEETGKVTVSDCDSKALILVGISKRFSATSKWHSLRCETHLGFTPRASRAMCTNVLPFLVRPSRNGRGIHAQERRARAERSLHQHQRHQVKVSLRQMTIADNYNPSASEASAQNSPLFARPILIAGDLQIHPIREKYFPILEGISSSALAKSIELQGAIDPATLYESRLLDGRTRDEVSKQLGRPRFAINFEDTPQGKAAAALGNREGMDRAALDYLFAKNVARRHYTKGQLGASAYRIADMPQGARNDLVPSAALRKVSQDKAAELYGVSIRSVQDAGRIFREGTPDEEKGMLSGAPLEPIVDAIASRKTTREKLAKQRELGITEPRKSAGRPHLLDLEDHERAVGVFLNGYQSNPGQWQILPRSQMSCAISRISFFRFFLTREYRRSRMTAKDNDQAPWYDVPDWVTDGDGPDWDALVAMAVRRDNLIARLEKLAAYTPDNSEPGEYANAQAAIKKLKAEILELTPTEVAPLPGLLDVLESIITELKRFFVLPERYMQAIALWVVHAHVFLHQIEDRNGEMRGIFDHTPRLIVWSQTHGSGKSTLGDFISKLVPNVESVSSLTGGELVAFMRRLAGQRNDPLIRKFYQDNGLLGPGLRVYLFDEAEQYKYTGLLMRMINAGHRHDGQIWDRRGNKVPIFAPMALLRRFDPRHEPKLKPTVSRSILIEIEKRDPTNPDHRREGFRARNPYVRRLAVLKQQIATVVERRLPDLVAWRPETNFLEGNRNADNWEPLIAIADLAGGDWPVLARELAEVNAQELENGEVEDATSNYDGTTVSHDYRALRTPRSPTEEINAAKGAIMNYLKGARRASRSDLHKCLIASLVHGGRN